MIKVDRYDVKNYVCPRCESTNLIAVHEPFCSHGRVNCKDCGARTMRWEHLRIRKKIIVKPEKVVFT